MRFSPLTHYWCNPTRHATVKDPLQSETSLKIVFHCLGPHKQSCVTDTSWGPPQRSNRTPCDRIE